MALFLILDVDPGGGVYYHMKGGFPRKREVMQVVRDKEPER